MPGKRWSARRAAAGLLLGMGAAALLVLMFQAAGYRGLLAAMVLLLGAFMLATQALPWRLAPASVLCALALQGTLAALWPNGLVHGSVEGAVCAVPAVESAVGVLPVAPVAAAGHHGLDHDGVQYRLDRLALGRRDRLAPGRGWCCCWRPCCC